MAMVLAISVFGAATAFAVWAIWTTVATDFPRIIDILRNGPVPTTAASLSVTSQPIAVRSVTRNVRVRSVRAAGLSLRAVA